MPNTSEYTGSTGSIVLNVLKQHKRFTLVTFSVSARCSFNSCSMLNNHKKKCTYPYVRIPCCSCVRFSQATFWVSPRVGALATEPRASSLHLLEDMLKCSSLVIFGAVTYCDVADGAPRVWLPLVAIGRHWSPLVAIGGHWWPLVAIGVIIADWHRLTLSNWKSSVFCWGMIPSGIQAGAVCQDLPQFNAWQLLRRLRACCWDESPTQWFAGT